MFDFNRTTYELEASSAKTMIASKVITDDIIGGDDLQFMYDVIDLLLKKEIDDFLKIDFKKIANEIILQIDNGVDICLITNKIILNVDNYYTMSNNEINNEDVIEFGTIAF